MMHSQVQYELAVRRSLARLRHMYQQMVGGYVRPQYEDIARIADGILHPVISGLEELADSMAHETGPDMGLTEFPPE